MAYVTKTVLVGADWTTITSKIAMLQFNDEMHMAITNGGTPTDTVGFVMNINEKYINSEDGIYVWAKTISGGSNIESVRVVENG